MRKDVSTIEGVTPRRAVIFHVNQTDEEIISAAIRGMGVEVWREKKLHDLKYTLTTHRPDFLFVGSSYLLKRQENIIGSLKKGTVGLAIVIVVDSGDRQGVAPHLTDHVAGFLLEPFLTSEIAFVLKRARKIAEAEIHDESYRELYGRSLDIHKVFIGRSSHSTYVRKKMLDARRGSGAVFIVGEEGSGKTYISYLIHFKEKGSLLPIRVYNPISKLDRERGLIKCLGGLHPAGTLVIKNTQNLTSLELSRLEWILSESQSHRGGFPRLIFHHDPSRGIAERFLEDTFVERITILPLRKRREDITPLMNFYINSFARLFDMPAITISSSARKILLNYSWPKNVADLIGSVFYCMLVSQGGAIYPYNLPDFISYDDPMAMEKISLESLFESKLIPLIGRMDLEKIEGLHPIVMSRVEIPLIRMILREMGGNQSKTAKVLGINRNTLRKKLDEYNIIG